MSSLASLFSSMARGENDDQKLVSPVPCPWCLSDDTKPVDDKGTFECTNCGEVFQGPQGS